ncbi:MAG: hypothetical protein M1825_004338 [Sarcosagium campestre]|nr:MAG: hypothetical protein M1825_004338 [Sarcosagium campestre]
MKYCYCKSRVMSLLTGVAILAISTLGASASEPSDWSTSFPSDGILARGLLEDIWVKADINAAEKRTEREGLMSGETAQGPSDMHPAGFFPIKTEASRNPDVYLEPEATYSAALQRVNDENLTTYIDKEILKKQPDYDDVARNAVLITRGTWHTSIPPKEIPSSRQQSLDVYLPSGKKYYIYWAFYPASQRPLEPRLTYGNMQDPLARSASLMKGEGSIEPIVPIGDPSRSFQRPRAKEANRSQGQWGSFEVQDRTHRFGQAKDAGGWRQHLFLRFYWGPSAKATTQKPTLAFYQIYVAK